MMATGQFALPTLEGLYQSDHQLVGVFTQPDRQGRGHHRHQNPVKQLAIEHDTPVFQPQKVNTDESLADLRNLEADLYVVAAYGQILSAELLAIPKFGAINLHASLLPKYRGAAPVQFAILRGENETGVTIFRLEPKLDAGPIVGVVTTEIGAKETSGDLEPRLAELAVPLTLQVLDQMENSTLDPHLQDSTQVTRAPRLKKLAGAIDWSLTARQIDWHIRAMQPWPNPFTFLESQAGEPLRLIVLEVEPSDVKSDAKPGTILLADRKSLVVQSGQGALEIVRLQPNGKRAMTTADFLCGHSVNVGDRLISEANSG